MKFHYFLAVAGLTGLPGLCDTLTLRTDQIANGIVISDGDRFVIDGNNEGPWKRQEIFRIDFQLNWKLPPKQKDKWPTWTPTWASPASPASQRDTEGVRSTVPIFKSKSSPSSASCSNAKKDQEAQPQPLNLPDSPGLDKLVLASGKKVFGRLECLDENYIKFRGYNRIDRAALSFLVLVDH